MSFTITKSYSLKGGIIFTHDERFARCPLVASNRGNASRPTYCVHFIDKDLFRIMNEIASWVNNELGDSCSFEIE